MLKPYFVRIPFSCKYFFTTICIVSIISYSIFLFLFVANTNLASLINDSVHYILMAQYMSPWHEASDIVISSWTDQKFPLFFPFLLAIFGIAYNYNAAHIFVACLLIISLPLIYQFLLRNDLSRWQAFLLTALFSISPSVFLNSSGILSENLYILITFLILNIYSKIKFNTRYMILAGVLLYLLFITRTIGLSMLAAFLFLQLLLVYKNKSTIYEVMIPAICFIILFMVISITNDKSIPSQYLHQIYSISNNDGNGIYSEYNIINNLIAIYESWMKSCLYYWFKYRPATIVIMIAGLLSIFGLILRIINYKLDAVYTFIYLAILLIWPHPGQTIRFIYPIFPLLLFYSLHSFFSLSKIFLNEKSYLLNIVFIIMLIFSLLPTFSFTLNRYKSGQHAQLNNITEYYRHPDLHNAELIADQQRIILSDFDLIRSSTEKDDLIFYFVPEYVKLLSNRNSERIIFKRYDYNNIRLRKNINAEYIYLTKLHPRYSRGSINGIDLVQYFIDWTDVVWMHRSSIDDSVVSALLKVKS